MNNFYILGEYSFEVISYEYNMARKGSFEKLGQEGNPYGVKKRHLRIPRGKIKVSFKRN